MTALPKHKTFNTGEISLMNQRALQQQGQRIAQLEKRLNEAEKALLEVWTALGDRMDEIQRERSRLNAWIDRALEYAERLDKLEQKRGPGRPKGSKNKPKAQPEGEQQPGEMPPDAA